MGVDFVSCVQTALAVRGQSARAAAIKAGLPIRSIQGVLEGHRPSIDRAAEICDALDLEFHIGPSRALTDAFTAAAPAAPERRLEFMSYDPEAAASRSAPPSPVETVETVRDRRLAELLAAIVSHWEALSSRYARDTWVADVYRWCPALSAQRSALSAQRSQRRSRGSAGG